MTKIEDKKVIWRPRDANLRLENSVYSRLIVCSVVTMVQRTHAKSALVLLTLNRVLKP